MSFAGKRVFIVGGSAGIGQATAVELARRGAHVWVAARGQAALEETVQRLKDVGGSGRKFGFTAFDVTRTEGVEAGVPAAIAELGGLDYLVCNTGFARTGTVQETPVEVFEEMLNLNFLGHVRVVRAALPRLIEQKSGHICLVSSMLGFMSAYGYGAYSASKFAIVGFAQALRQELKEHEVGVSVFYPPTTRTPGLEKENEGKSELIWELERNNNFTRTYEAHDVALALLSQLEQGKFEGVTGVDSWVVRKLTQLAPPLARFFADDELSKARKSVKG